MTVDILKKQTVDKLPNDLEGMEASMQRLLSLIDDVYKYVDNVVVSNLTGSSIISHYSCLGSDPCFSYSVSRKDVSLQTIT